MQQVKHWLLPVRNYNNGFFIHTKLLVLPGVFLYKATKKSSSVELLFLLLQFLCYPRYPFMIPRLLLRTNMMISSLSLEAGISASILSMASELFNPD